MYELLDDHTLLSVSSLNLPTGVRVPPHVYEGDEPVLQYSQSRYPGEFFEVNRDFPRANYDVTGALEMDHIGNSGFIVNIKGAMKVTCFFDSQYGLSAYDVEMRLLRHLGLAVGCWKLLYHPSAMLDPNTPLVCINEPWHTDYITHRDIIDYGFVSGDTIHMVARDEFAG